MNNLKFGVLGCALLGLVGAFLPYTPGGAKGLSFFELREIPGYGIQVAITLAGFAVALVMSAIPVAKPPMRRWQAIVAAVGFGWVLLKLRYGFMNLVTDGPLGAKMISISAIAGLVFAILCVAKPETAK